MRWTFMCCAQLSSVVTLWAGCFYASLQDYCSDTLMQRGWCGFQCICMHKATGATQQLCLHSYEWKSLMKSHLPSLLTSAFRIKIPSPQAEESFYLYCNTTRSACPGQNCAAQTALGPAEEFLITSAISWIHFHSELWQECKGNHITDQLSFTF